MSDPAPTPASPIVPRLRLEFTYDFDEFAEAQQAYASGGSTGGKWRSWAGWLLFGGLALILFMLMNQRPAPRPTPPIVPPPPAQNWVNNILLPVIPWVLIFGVIWFFVFRQLRRGGAFPKTESMLYEPGEEPPPRPRRRDAEAGSSLAWALIAVPLVAVAFVLIYLFRGGGPSVGGGDWWRVVLPVVPWLLIFLFVYFFLFRYARGGLKALWDAQTSLHRPHVVEIYDDRIVFSDAVDRLEHKWEAFTHVRESPGLFLLFTSNYSMHILPKRAFPGRGGIDEFRELIRRAIAQRPGPAFPVLPAG